MEFNSNGQTGHWTADGNTSYIVYFEITQDPATSVRYGQLVLRGSSSVLKLGPRFSIGAVNPKSNTDFVVSTQDGAPAYSGSVNSSDVMENPEPVEKFNLFFANDYEAAEVLEKLRELPLTFTCVTDSSLEINASGVSKAEGLKTLCARLAIEPAECIAVGDSENDEPMLKLCGLSAATANATDKVKAMADVLAPDCNNDPVAQIIDEYLLA